MDISLESGKYVLAVSGGVDSMALLDLLRQQAGVKLTVAHFDHGIRSDSHEDRRLVAELARKHGLPFVYDEGNLGAGASEAEARSARYAFLRRVQQATGAKAIITAHHKDDALETAVLNILRGTGRKGLTALSDRHDTRRPLLHISKQQLIDHAREQGLVWREDSTNHNQTYLRNYIRHRIVPRLNKSGREQLSQIITRLHEVNKELDEALTRQLHLQSTARKLDRNWFNSLPHNVSREIMAAWLRANGIRDFDRKTIERLVVLAKVAAAGKQLDIVHGWSIKISTTTLSLLQV